MRGGDEGGVDERCDAHAQRGGGYVTAALSAKVMGRGGAARREIILPAALPMIAKVWRGVILPAVLPAIAKV